MSSYTWHNGLPMTILNSWSRGFVNYVLSFAANLENSPNSIILASAHDPNFLARVLPKHSLCNALGIKTPQYTPILVPH